MTKLNAYMLQSYIMEETPYLRTDVCQIGNGEYVVILNHWFWLWGWNDWEQNKGQFQRHEPRRDTSGPVRHKNHRVR